MISLFSSVVYYQSATNNLANRIYQSTDLRLSTEAMRILLKSCGKKTACILHTHVVQATTLVRFRYV